MPNLYDEKSVDLSRLDEEVSDLLQIYDNLAINPNMANVLTGTHTAAIRRVYTSNTARNVETVGWQIKTGTGGAATMVDCAGDAESQKVTVTIVVSGGGEVVKFRQVFASTVDGVNQHLKHVAKSLRDLTLNFAIDVETDTARSAGARAYVYTYTSGGIGTTTFGDYHGNNTDNERLSVAALVPSDAIEVHVGVELEVYGVTVYTMRKAMLLAASGELDADMLSFRPRNRVDLHSAYLDPASSQFTYLSAVDTNYKQSGIGASGITADFDFNANRPAWATGAELLYAGSGGAAASYSFLKPNGATSQYASVGCVSYTYNSVKMPLGADGQVQLMVGNTNNDVYINVLRWVGEGL